MSYQIGNVLDVLPTLAAGRFRCCVTSPPYWGLRAYLDGEQVIVRRDLTPEQIAYVDAELRKAGLL